ncbi:MAG: hypothetical protein FWB91_05385 [Defluviitaleaceae bacterium]|nr:hypothetical protein [Defluviitaleaceae bacterium]
MFKNMRKKMVVLGLLLSIAGATLLVTPVAAYEADDDIAPFSIGDDNENSDQ